MIHDLQKLYQFLKPINTFCYFYKLFFFTSSHITGNLNHWLRFYHLNNLILHLDLRLLNKILNKGQGLLQVHSHVYY